MTEKPIVIRRREARVAAIHIIFAAISSDTSTADCHKGVSEILSGKRKQLALNDPLTENMTRVFDYRRSDIEEWITSNYERPLIQMTMIERAIISAATAEMLYSTDTPSAVIINEAIEIAKEFGAEGGSALVNGVLNGIARDHR